MKTPTRTVSLLALCLLLPTQVISQLFDDASQFTPTSNTHPPLTDQSIRDAVHAWVTSTDKSHAMFHYGPIAQWNTSRVTNMARLFTNARFFDDDLSGWDVSGVTSMTYLFAFCSSFNSQLEGWDVSRVTDLSFAFHHATQFEGKGLAHWDTSNVKDLTYFAQGASAFTEDIGMWDTAQVQSFNRAFHNATSFDQQLCWNLSPTAAAVQTFCNTKGASFACDPHQTLQTDINQHSHNCCDCGYDANQHYYGYHNDDDYTTIPYNGFPETTTTDDKKMGVILASVIWAMVFVMLVLVGVVTLRRRQEVRQWLQTKLSSSSIPRTVEVAPDGGAIATFIGPAEGSTSATTNTSSVSSSGGTTPPPTAAEDSILIPMVIADDWAPIHPNTTSATTGLDLTGTAAHLEVRSPALDGAFQA